MSFQSQLQSFSAKAARNVQAVHDGVVDEAFRSIVEGSEITAAPGQPFDPVATDKNAGELRDSWVIEKTSDTSATISTDVLYAQNVEDNVRGVNFRNHGPHSVKLTVAGFPKIVEVVVERVKVAA